MKRTKKNPRRVPLPASAREARARETAAELVWAVFFTVLWDKEGYDAEGLQRVWTAAEHLLDSIAQGRVCVRDLMKVLRDEAGVVLE